MFTLFFNFRVSQSLHALAEAAGDCLDNPFTLEAGLHAMRGELTPCWGRVHQQTPARMVSSTCMRPRDLYGTRALKDDWCQLAFGMVDDMVGVHRLRKFNAGDAFDPHFFIYLNVWLTIFRYAVVHMWPTTFKHTFNVSRTSCAKTNPDFRKLVIYVYIYIYDMFSTRLHLTSFCCFDSVQACTFYIMGLSGLIAPTLGPSNFEKKRE